MVSVTNRISKLKQPRRGSISTRNLGVWKPEDDWILNASKNVHHTTIGLALVKIDVIGY